MCDIDRFKTINDKYGHEFGDAVLIQIARVFHAFSNDHKALVARHGGEEFAALLTNVTVAQATELAELLRERCASQIISSAGASAHITISIGLAVWEDRMSLSRLMSVADNALYEAKDGGRNRIAIASPPKRARTAQLGRGSIRAATEISRRTN
jgi:diguanylate cyclase (GGDEF)-like protein